MSFFSKLRGTMESIFQIGKAGPNIKNNSGVVEIRDTNDSAFAILRASGSPVGDNDLITKLYFENNNAAANGVTMAKMPLSTSSKTSTTVLPDNAIIRDCWLDIETAYDGGTTIKIERDGDATVVLMDTNDNNPVKVNTYHVPQVQDWGSTGNGFLKATVTGTPAAGAATIYVAYSTPTDIS